MYHWCLFCSNTTIIAFQDENGFLQIGNLTFSGWTLNQLGQALEPVMGTGLALHYSGARDQINLFYQKSSLNLAQASWNPVHQECLSTIIHSPVSC